MTAAAPAARPALQLFAVSKAFTDQAAVCGLSLSVAAGELYALLGANGAGKTTTLRMVAGLLAPDEGRIEILGHDLLEAPSAAKRPLAFLPDEPQLYAKLRSLEYLEFVAGLWEIDGEAAARRAEHWLRWLELWEVRGQYIETYSRGMQQKLALAGALIREPRLLVLDEPLTGLDVASARRIREQLVALAHEGVAVLFTTHIIDVAQRMATRIGLLRHGRMIAEGTLQELQQRVGDGHDSLEDIVLELTEPAACTPAPAPSSGC